MRKREKAPTFIGVDICMTKKQYKKIDDALGLRGQTDFYLIAQPIMKTEIIRVVLLTPLKGKILQSTFNKIGLRYKNLALMS